MRFCITPRWGGGPDDAWYPWLRRELRGHEVLVARLEPSPRAPAIRACKNALLEQFGDDPGSLARTVLIGHSVGCQANLRYLEALQPGLRVAGVLSVAGWWTLDDPRPALRPWIETPLDPSRIRGAAARFVTLISDDDPHTADQLTNLQTWKSRLGAEVRIVSGAGHFLRAREPDVLEALRDLVGLAAAA